jgi:glycosyltransferase involved in cell wall biosynthesis
MTSEWSRWHRLQFTDRMSKPTGKLRIACYGYADCNAGSVSAAGFAILRELLSRGHEFDFFGNKSFVYPRELEAFPNFSFVQVSGKLEERLYKLFSALPGRPLRSAFDGLRNRIGCAHLINTMCQAHRNRPYDLQLFLGTWAFGRIPSVPVISWVQGPPGTDGRSISRHAKQIKQLCGSKEYWMLRAYAWYREHFGRPPFHHTDVVICGSGWSRRVLAEYGVPLDRTHALPYPVDLDRFCPPSQERPAGEQGQPLVLWLGRTVPRKRLDLFLDACDRLITSGQKILVLVIGGFGFAAEYRRLIEQFRYPEQLRHIESLDRDAVAALVRSAAVLVQPSEEENFGSSVAEAVACGTPVVVGPTNGTGDYIGQGGVRFDRYESDAVAAAIAKAIADSVRLRPAACAAARQFLSPDSIATDLVALLYAAVAQNRQKLNQLAQGGRALAPTLRHEPQP